MLSLICIRPYCWVTIGCESATHRLIGLKVSLRCLTCLILLPQSQCVPRVRASFCYPGNSLHLCCEIRKHGLSCAFGRCRVSLCKPHRSRRGLMWLAPRMAIVVVTLRCMRCWTVSCLLRRTNSTLLTRASRRHLCRWEPVEGWRPLIALSVPYHTWICMRGL